MFWKYNWPTIAWAALIWALCTIPGSDLPEIGFWEHLGVDKIVHLGLFVVFIYLMLRGFNKQTSFSILSQRSVVIALALTIFYGAMMEVFQDLAFVERTADPWDFAANTAGCLLGLVAYRRFPLP